jgi:hypothetical protein
MPAGIRIVIDAVEPVLAGQLGEFLQLFERIYLGTRTEAVRLSPLLDIDDANLSQFPLWEHLEDEFERIWEHLPLLADHHRPFHEHGEGLRLAKFSKNSPIELITVGLPIAFTAAAIFSGGQVRLPGLEFRLPPLGVGIAALRHALGLAGPREKLPKGTLRHGLARKS